MSTRDEACAALLDDMQTSDIAAWCGRNGFVLCRRKFIEQVAAQQKLTVTFDEDGGCHYKDEHGAAVTVQRAKPPSPPNHGGW